MVHLSMMGSRVQAESLHTSLGRDGGELTSDFLNVPSFCMLSAFFKNCFYLNQPLGRPIISSTDSMLPPEAK